MSLARSIPDVDLLLALPPEEVGLQLLMLAADGLQNGIFAKDGIAGPSTLFVEGYAPQTPCYPRTRQDDILLAVGEAWQWLENAILIIPAPQPNNSFSRLTRRGLQFVKDRVGFRRYCEALQFPKAMLHPLIADAVWIQLSQGNLDVAVFVAFKAVEEAVRDAGSFSMQSIGKSLMHEAFHKDTGPLSRNTEPVAEREALMHLFAGAIGSYKNPHSHRTVGITDSREAQEMVILASHLLRIVDARKTSD